MGNEDIQRRLAPYYKGAIDGILGKATYAAMFDAAAGRELGELSDALGRQAALSFPIVGITSPIRIAHYLAQASHETGGFRYLNEIWGPTPAQVRYEGRADLGNTQPGDGRRYCGRGIFQVTGRANYRVLGQEIGFDLEGHPERAAEPAIAVMAACRYWSRKNLNLFADVDDVTTITKKINGGENGLADRKARLAHIRGILGC